MLYDPRNLHIACFLLRIGDDATARGVEVDDFVFFYGVDSRLGLFVLHDRVELVGQAWLLSPHLLHLIVLKRYFTCSLIRILIGFVVGWSHDFAACYVLLLIIIVVLLDVLDVVHVVVVQLHGLPWLILLRDLSAISNVFLLVLIIEHVFLLPLRREYLLYLLDGLLLLQARVTNSFENLGF